MRGFLHLERLALFFGDLAVDLSLHQLGRRVDIADQRVDGLHIVSVQSGPDVLRGFGLPLAARAQEIEHGIVLRRVAEIVSDDRLEHVVH